jgi:hypothetical protein
LVSAPSLSSFQTSSTVVTQCDRTLDHFSVPVHDVNDVMSLALTAAAEPTSVSTGVRLAKAIIVPRPTAGAGSTAGSVSRSSSTDSSRDRLRGESSYTPPTVSPSPPGFSKHHADHHPGAAAAVAAHSCTWHALCEDHAVGVAGIDSSFFANCFCERL